MSALPTGRYHSFTIGAATHQHLLSQAQQRSSSDLHDLVQRQNNPVVVKQSDKRMHRAVAIHQFAKATLAKQAYRPPATYGNVTVKSANKIAAHKETAN